MDALFRSIRQACSAATWSQGVELVRAGAVVGARSDGDEVELRVATRGGLSAPAVTLYLDEPDWSCECPSHEEVCCHVAAAVIALRQARQAGTELPRAAVEEPGHVGYRFGRRDGRLALSRVVVRGEAEAPVTTLVSMAKASGGEARFVASQQDLRIEAVNGSFSSGVIPRERLRSILEALVDAPDVTFEGKPARIGAASSGVCARVEECAAGFRVRVEQDPSVSELFANGALRLGDALVPLCDHGLGERRLAELRRGVIYGAGEVGTLAGQILPELRKRVPVVVDAPSLPQSMGARARIGVSTRRDGDSLQLLATILYGDPPAARVAGDRLIPLGRGAVPVRDPRREQQLGRALRDRLGLEPGHPASYEGEQAIAMAGRLAGLGADFIIEGEGHTGFFVAGALAPQVCAGDGGGLDFWFETAADGGPGARSRGRAGAAAVLAAWERGDTLVSLLEGGFGRVPAGWLEQHAQLVVDLLQGREPAGGPGAAAGPWSLLDAARLCAALDAPPPPRLGGLATLLSGFDGLPEPELPADLEAELRGYQRRGVAWLQLLGKAGLGALLADDMGLGKTLQTLCAVRGKTLVVAPTSVIHNWAAEAARFRPRLGVSIYHGPGRRLDDAELTLTTYAILRQDAPQLAQRVWDTVVLDESQAIKNPDSQVARAAYGLRAGFKIALTGTPVENRLEDLWSQLHFLNPGLLGGRQRFEERYGRAIAAGDERVASGLRQRLRPLVLRRLKGEVARELPPRTDVVRYCELGEEERRLYDAVRAATRDEVVSRLGEANTLAVLDALLRLRQAACHPALLPGHAARAAVPSAKVALLVELLEEALAEGHKAIVFSQWTSLLDLIEPQLRRAAMAWVRLDGSTRDRAAVVQSFQDPSGPPLLIASLKAGGTGLNLTAADHVFLLDPWWNPAAEEQAADRAHRIGQDRPVLVHRLVAKDTVEERVLALQEHKRRLAGAALEEASAGRALTREDLLALLD